MDATVESFMLVQRLDTTSFPQTCPFFLTHPLDHFRIIHACKSLGTKPLLWLLKVPKSSFFENDKLMHMITIFLILKIL